MTWRSIDESIRIAARQHHGVLTRAEILRVGATAVDIRRLLRSGWMSSLSPGVYRVGSGLLPWHGWARAAVLGCGGDALAASWTVLHLEEVASEPHCIDVLTTGARRPRPGIRLHRTGGPIPDNERTELSGVPCTTLARAFVDVAPDCSPLRLLKYMRKAAFRGVLDVDAIRAAERRLRPRGDTKNIRRALSWFDRGDGGADSGLEEQFHAMVIAAGIVEPRTNLHLPPLRPHERADFLFEVARLVVETDGPHHLDPDVQRDDARRDRALGRGGFRVLRFWWWEIEEHPAAVLRRLRAALAACHPEGQPCCGGDAI